MKNLSKICLLLCLWCCGLAHAGASHYNTDSLLRVLDATIDSTDAYEGALRARIRPHRVAFENATSLEGRMREADWLFKVYKRFRVDSAMYFARERVKMAAEFPSPDSLLYAKINEADALKRYGRFRDGIDVLNSLPRNEYIRNSKYFYNVYFSILNSTITTAYGPEEYALMKKLHSAYRDTIFAMNLDTPSLNCANRAEMLKAQGKFDEALKVLLDAQGFHASAVVGDPVYWAVLADTYKQKGDMEGAKYCYAMSALLDKRNCNKTYTSLQNLAGLLFGEGDTDRAYRYITTSMTDVREAHALSRLALVGEYLPIITTAYDKKRQSKALWRMITIGFSVVVAIVLGFLLVQLWRRTKKLANMRKKLAERNEQLHQLNHQLHAMNSALKESNIIKEVYIGQLFNLCSGYIGQIEDFRIGLIGKLKSGKVKDVERALNQSTANAQLKSLFKNFDRVFLEIFPNFVADFNALLQPGEEITPKPGELLSPELRIYALVRLGINDSTKIAEFLHYSVQTVYNYRQRTRNKANMTREEFVARVQSL
ncbi:MAG: DUF6377 domain-containing protein [Bacteroidales bacterium]|nr:DUF6377 domain-containing protein [Bacteroidales bacterium]